ncbi:MAG: phage integrase family protein [Chloroflexi bacterium]|nr:MAG: phage integrase family protein [Chloroflexota bacterium]
MTPPIAPDRPITAATARLYTLHATTGAAAIATNGATPASIHRIAVTPTSAAASQSEASGAGDTNRIRKRSGVRRFHAHLLRHTWATNWMKGPGADLLSLQRQGGWERLEMVERYSHAVPIRDRAALPNPLAQATLVHYRRDAQAV